MAFTGCALPEALTTITQIPARLLRMESTIGALEGSMADLVLLTPETHIVGVWVNGRQVLPLQY